MDFKRCRALFVSALFLGACGQHDTDDTPPRAEVATSVQAAMALFGQQDFAGAAEMLDAVTVAEPDNGRARMLLGLALQKAGDLDRAEQVDLEAIEIEGAAPRAMYNLASVHALRGDADGAFEWLTRAKDTGKIDVTGAGIDPDLVSIKDDPRMATLMPTTEEFADPFVETARILASDWPNNALGRSTGRIYVHSGADGSRLLTLTGEAGGDGFGIGPADAGDVDGDGHDDLVIGAWQHGSAAPSGGKVYLYSGKTGRLMRTWTGKVPGETFGFDATGVGDVDGDGEIDFLLTSAWSVVHGPRSGRMFILSGE